jgi:hypothetical protein
MDRARLDRKVIAMPRRAGHDMPVGDVDPLQALLLSLGRSAGNRAVAGLVAPAVQRQPEEEPVPAPPTEGEVPAVDVAAPPAPAAGPKAVDVSPSAPEAGPKAVDVAASVPEGGPEEVTTPREKGGEAPGVSGNLRGRWLAKVVSPAEAAAAAVGKTPPDLTAAIDALDAAGLAATPIHDELDEHNELRLAGRASGIGAWLIGAENTLAATRRRQSDAALRSHTADAAKLAAAFGKALAGK